MWLYVKQASKTAQCVVFPNDRHDHPQGVQNFLKTDAHASCCRVRGVTAGIVLETRYGTHYCHTLLFSKCRMENEINGQNYHTAP